VRSINIYRQLPAKPSLQSPDDGATFDEGDDITLCWADTGDEYYGEVWRGPEGTLPFGWQSGTCKYIGPLEGEYTYWWHVKASSECGEGDWSSIWSFTVQEPAIVMSKLYLPVIFKVYVPPTPTATPIPSPTPTVAHTPTPVAGIVWSEEVNISNDALGSTAPKLAVDSQGGVHVVWKEVDAVHNCQVLYTHRPYGGDWSTPERISDPSVPVFHDGSISIAVDPEDGVHVTWPEGDPSYRLYYIYKPTDGSWSTPTVIPGTDNMHTSRIECDSEGGLHLLSRAWDTDLYYLYRPESGGWANPQNLSKSSTAFMGHRAIDNAHDVIHVAFTDSRTGDLEVYHTFKPISGGSWSSLQRVSDTPGTSYPAAGCAVDSEGTFHTTWTEVGEGMEKDIFYAYKPYEGPWSAPVNITNDPEYSAPPAMAVDTSDTIHLAFGEPARYMRKPKDGGWTPHVQIASQMSAGPLASRYNILYLMGTVGAWDDPTSEIYYVEGHPEIIEKVEGTEHTIRRTFPEIIIDGQR